MKRLLLLPAAAAVVTVVWCAGLAWPIATQVYSLLAPRPATGDTEADWPA